MKKDQLIALGLDEETAKKVMDINGGDIENAKAALTEKVSELETSSKGLQERLGTATEALKRFDGKDPDKALQERDDALKALQEAQEKHSAELSERDFLSALDTGILEAKGKNAKAIKALLDMDTLKTSRNQKEDVAAAIKALAESDSYLFDTENNPKPTPAKISSGGEHQDPGAGGDDSFVAAAMKGARLDTSKGD